jgi:subfamily B ATP-binding cassette protein MsbA
MNLSLLLAYAAPYRASLALSGMLMLLETGAALAVPWLGGQFAGGVLSGGQFDMRWILLALLALFAFQALLKFANSYLLGRSAERILADLRIRVYDHLQALPLAFYHQRRQGDILALMTYEVEHLSSFITGTLLSVIPLLLTVGGAVLFMYRTDAQLAVMVAALIPMFYLMLKIMGRKLRPLARELQTEHATAELVSFLLYAGLLTRPVSALASVYGQTQQARGTLERMQSVLSERTEPIHLV